MNATGACWTVTATCCPPPPPLSLEAVRAFAAGYGRIGDAGAVSPGNRDGGGAAQVGGVTAEAAIAPYDGELRVWFARVTASTTELGRLLLRPEYRPMAGAVESINSGDGLWRTRQYQARALRRFARQMRLGSTRCRNGRVADFNVPMSACVGANAVCYNIGVGGAALAASFYLCKYHAKGDGDTPAMQAQALSNVKAAADHVRANPSTAEDTGEPQRVGKHIMQRFQNMTSPMSAAAAVAVLLGQHSAFHTSGVVYYNGAQTVQAAKYSAREGQGAGGEGGTGCPWLGADGGSSDSDCESESDGELPESLRRVLDRGGGAHTPKGVHGWPGLCAAPC